MNKLKKISKKDVIITLVIAGWVVGLVIAVYKAANSDLS
jgi:flagellar biosynthesis protein FliQ